MKYPKIKKVKVLKNYFLKISFDNGETKIYDFKPNFQYDFFSQLRDYSIFRKITVDVGGYGISWNDSEYELYTRGI